VAAEQAETELAELLEEVGFTVYCGLGTPFSS
jgi:hypothetical protein